MAQPKHSIIRVTDIRAGKSLYREEFHKVDKIQILSCVKQNEYGSYYFIGRVLGSNRFWENEPREFYLGDAGVVKYDDRPCTLFTTEKAAKAAMGKFLEWSKAFRFNDPVEDYRYNDDW